MAGLTGSGDNQWTEGGVISDPLALIAEERREGVRKALSAAFGAVQIGAVSPVMGGVSGASTYRIEAGGKLYLLRLDLAQRGGLRDPARSYACTRAAAEAGIAPALHHADAAAGIAIMDFVPERPLAAFPGGVEGIVRELGGLVARLQATPVFPALADYPTIIARMIAYVRGAGVFAPGLLDPHAEIFERIRAAYPWDASPPVSSHNDPNPRNILFDGERIWLIDWEAAYRNDPFVDIAIIANEFASTAALEDLLLRSWLNAEPSPRQRAQLTLMRQLALLYYPLLGFSIAVDLPRAEPISDLTALSEAEFRARVGDGRLLPGSPETMQELGKMMLAGFLAGAAMPRFGEALAAVRQG